MKHYVVNDKTGLAVLLTAPWGSGKSYFIKNTLIDYIETKTEYRCILISLYGITSIEDLKETIMLNLLIHSNSSKFQKLAKSGVNVFAKAICGYIFNKTRLNITSMIKSLSEYITFNNKLIIFDDLERTQIDLINVMGFINQISENENSKILIVANESAITNNDNIETSIAKKYLLIKEKTVGSTLKYECDYLNAVRNILFDIKNKELRLIYSTEDEIRYIYNLLQYNGEYNLRTLIYALQKVSDILNYFNIVEHRYIKTIFESVILFAHNIKHNEFPKWEGTKYLSTSLGNIRCPLFYFCYDFICNFNIDKDTVAPTIKSFESYYHYTFEYHTDKNLEIIFQFYTQEEHVVINALDILETRLSNDEIPIACYGKICYYLVVLGDLLDYDYSHHKDFMVKNVYQKGDKIDFEIIFLSLNISYNANLQKELVDFEETLIKSSKDYENFDYLEKYTPDELYDFCVKIINSDINEYILDDCFISNFNFDKLLDVLIKSSSNQVDKFRRVLFRFYRNVYSTKYKQKDWDFIKRLSIKIDENLECDSLKIDRIVKLQLGYLRDNLKKFVDKK